MTRSKQIALGCTMGLLIWAIMTTTAYAYNLLPLCVRFQSPNSLKARYVQDGSYSYSLVITDGIGRWNRALSGTINVTETMSSSANLHFYSDSYSNVSWAGNCRYPNAALPNTATIKLNEYYLGSASVTFNYNRSLNATLHEMGHAFGLNHSTSSTSIMQSANNDQILTPSTDDINGIKAKYSNERRY